MPDRGTIKTSLPLSNVAAGYLLPKYIWNKVLPAVGVDKEDGKYYIFGDDFLRYYGKKRADKTESQRIDSYSASTTTYSCEEHTYNDVVSARERNEADSIIKPEMRVTKSLTATVDLDIEIETMTLVFTAGNYASGFKATVSTKWDEVNGDPIGEVDTAKDLVATNTGADPDELIMVVGKSVHKKLKRHADLLEMFKYTEKGILSEAKLAEAFGVKEYIVGKGSYINSMKGQTKTKTDIWGNFCAILYRADAPAKETPSWGYVLLHKLFGGLTAKVNKFAVPKLGQGATQIEATRSFVAVKTSINAGYLFTAPVSA